MLRRWLSVVPALSLLASGRIAFAQLPTGSVTTGPFVDYTHLRDEYRIRYLVTDPSRNVET
jgi:hypothetical protein